MSSRRLTAEQAAARLGVKVDTVYAYVSRGHLQSARSPGGRTSTFDAAEVEQLARRGRPRRSSRSPHLDIQIRTSITEVHDGELSYRGHRVADLALTRPFEDVAALLWTAALPPDDEAWMPWTHGRRLEVPSGSAVDRLRVLAALCAFDDPMRSDLSVSGVAASGQRLVASVVDSLSPVAARARRRVHRLELQHGVEARSGTIAGRLAAQLSAGSVDRDLVSLCNTALVVLADHELAASTLAARVAAATRADPYGVVGAGLGPFSGALHGTASRDVRTMLDSSIRDGAATAVADALRLHGFVPGFGHSLYPQGDPRAALMLEQLVERRGQHAEFAHVRILLTTVVERVQIHPNVDFALAALGHVAHLEPDSGEALFAVARMAGWLAHALEEYGERPLRFRPRAVFVAGGARDGSGSD
ncbi:citrate synthase [soil metagenome]